MNSPKKPPKAPKAKKKAIRGFAAMTPEMRTKLSSLGGKAVSANREHMRMLGRKGGEVTSKIEGHMSKIGKLGAISRKST